MSTRGFIGFVIDGTEKIAYNHYDSYPSALGLNVLHWLHVEPQAEPEQAVPDGPGQRDDGDQQDGQDRGRGEQQPEASVSALLRALSPPGTQQASYRQTPGQRVPQQPRHRSRRR